MPSGVAKGGSQENAEAHVARIVGGKFSSLVVRTCHPWVFAREPEQVLTFGERTPHIPFQKLD